MLIATALTYPPEYEIVTVYIFEFLIPAVVVVPEIVTGLGNISNTVWSWLIIAIVGIVIIALVLFYANQNKNTTTYHNDDNE